MPKVINVLYACILTMLCPVIVMCVFVCVCVCACVVYICTTNNSLMLIQC